MSALTWERSLASNVRVRKVVTTPFLGNGPEPKAADRSLLMQRCNRSFGEGNYGVRVNAEKEHAACAAP